MPSQFKIRLKELRELRGLSQSDLAARTGLQATAVSHFETGKRSPSFDNLRRLSDALEVSSDYLLGRIDNIDSVGPKAGTLLRHLDEMTSEDVDFLESMAEQLASKKSKKKP